MGKLRGKALQRAREDARAKAQPGEPGYKPDERRAAIPTAMVQPCCQRKGCDERATWVPVMVLQSSPFALEPWESRAPSPSSALCSKHRDELELHPDMMLTEAAWQNIIEQCLRKGRAMPERHLLAWEFEPLPDLDDLAEKVGELRAKRASAATAKPMNVH